jgi:hypothetical protein
MELINKSINPILKKIVIKNFKSYEPIENEIRILIDLNIVYIEIKNSLEKIIDHIVDRFKIIDKDTLTKNLIIHIYSSKVRECILKINKILLNENINKVKLELNKSKIESELNKSKVESELNKSKVELESKNDYFVKYLTDEIIKCIFTDDIINDIINLSEDSEFNLINILKSNWKKVIIVLLILIAIALIRKGYHYLFKLK